MANKDIIWVQVKVGSSTNGSDILSIEERLHVTPGMNRWVVLTEMGDHNFPETSGRGIHDAVTKYIGYKVAKIYEAQQAERIGGTQKKPEYTINEVKDE